MEVSGNKLTIKSTENIIDAKRIAITLNTAKLSKISIHGSGNVVVLDNFEPEEFVAEVSGSGNIKGKAICKSMEVGIHGSGVVDMSGQTTKSDIDINGSGQFNGFDIVGGEVSVEINGSGDANVHASTSLNAEVNGSGNITYIGNPQPLEISINGSGQVKKR